jgi:uncharacterized protein RhaS with RHS repeats
MQMDPNGIRGPEGKGVINLYAILILMFKDFLFPKSLKVRLVQLATSAQLFSCKKSPSSPIKYCTSSYQFSSIYRVLTSASLAFIGLLLSFTASTTAAQPLQQTYKYSYSAAGYKTRLTLPDATPIDYSYSAHGQLETVSIPGEGNISVSQFKWLEPAKITLPGGTAQERTLDGLLNLEALKVKTPGQQTVLSVANTYGKVQELKTSNRSDTPGNAGNANSVKNSQYSYDDETRLTQAKTDTGGLFGTETENFTLDAVGNRIAHSKVNGAWAYDANNRLTKRGSGPCGSSGVTCYDWDEAGNLTQKTQGTGSSSKITQFSYDT